MPPHRLLIQLSSTFKNQNLWRAGKCLILAATIALAGCATNAQNKYADSSSRNLRDNYLSRTQSDPLGAYINVESVNADSSHNSATSTDTKPTRALASTALRFLGIRYRYGGSVPKSGFDCSGLVAYVAEKSLGLKLPRRAAEMAHEGTAVPRDNLKKGDLVFFNTRGRRDSHVGIYLGDHKFVHAPRRGQVVRVESMDEAYWRKRYNGARRLVAANDSPEKLAKEALNQR